MDTNQQNLKKKNMSVKLVARGAGGGGGAGLAGMVLLGGALALVTTFAFKRKQKSEKNKQEDSLKKCIVKQDHEILGGEGLSFLVQDSLSPHADNQQDHSASGTVATQDEVCRKILLDENKEIIVGNDEEVDNEEKARDGASGDESSISKEEFLVPVDGSLLLLKPEEVNEKNESPEEVDEETMTADCNQVADANNDWQVQQRIEGNNQEQVKASHATDQLGLDEKARKQEEECDGNGMTIIDRGEILVEGGQTNQPVGIYDDSHKLDDECDGNGESILEEREEPVEAAVVDQARPDDKLHMRGEECDDDAGIITEKHEELVGEVVAADEIILSEELEVTAMYGDQDTLCSAGTVLMENKIETCDSKEPELLLPLTDSSSVIKPGDNDLSEDHLVVEDTKILRGDDANEAAVQEDESQVKDKEQTELVEANGDNKEYYKICKENGNDISEEADEISVENDQQMQPGEEFQKIHIIENEEKYDSGNFLPEINSFQHNGFEVPEFSFPPLDSPSLSKPENFHKYDSAETTLHVGVINPVEKDGLAEEAFACQMMLENKSTAKSAQNDETQICDDGGDNAAAKEEETLNTSLVDTAQPTNLSEEEDNNDDSKEVEAVEITQRENFEVENNLHLPQKDLDYDNDNIGGKETENDEGVEDDYDEEEEDIDNNTEEDDVEESSETTGDSSLDSTAEAIWPDESELEFSQKVRDMQGNKQQDLKEIEEEDSDSYVKFNSHKLEDDDRDGSEMAYTGKLSADTATLKQPTNFFNLKFWFLALLVPFLLLLLLSTSQLSHFASFEYHLE
ncbi:uncharacterized protein LOC108223003 isoform X2 [Daucus carota subsp. sativus]|uniref:uncharacterized protein LOC108223003 isoform X2 n=1 Tax=Daucus carota subsp. sativus TaxID=79200 RepID=UPI0007F049DC|nr:PREDICTED: midasin-like isoform X2 [Daucus carota subsp. sativus]